MESADQDPWPQRTPAAVTYGTTEPFLVSSGWKSVVHLPAGRAQRRLPGSDPAPLDVPIRPTNSVPTNPYTGESRKTGDRSVNLDRRKPPARFMAANAGHPVAGCILGERSIMQQHA